MRWRRRLIRRLAAFSAAAALSLICLTGGTVCGASAAGIKDSEYNLLLSGGGAENLYAATKVCPERIDAYMGLVNYCSDHLVVNKDLSRLANTVLTNAPRIGEASPEATTVYYDTGRLILSEWDGSLKARASAAGALFRKAEKNRAYEKRELAGCYSSICTFLTEESRISEHSADEYEALLKKMKACLDAVEERTDRESNYDRISLYCIIYDFIKNQSVNMAAQGVDGGEVKDLLYRACSGAEAITSKLPYVLRLREKMNEGMGSVEETVSVFFRNNEGSGKEGDKP